MKKIWLITIVVFGSLLMLFNAYFSFQVARNFFILPGEKEAITLKVKPGESVSHVADKLVNKGVISSKYLFLIYTHLLGQTGSLPTGRYSLEAPMSIIDLSDKLYFSPPAPQVILTIPAGKTLSQTETILAEEFPQLESSFSEMTVGQIQDEHFILQDAPAEASLEGYIYPETYYFSESASLEGILNKILNNWTNKLTPSFITKMKMSKWNMHQLITLASLVEKEVSDFEEKKIVAGILQKRLRVDMPLQVDSTINYITGKSDPQATINDTKIDSLYNTYRYADLPPGPICNPSLESLRAVLQSKDTPYWYYLSTPEGETIFSENFEQHLSAKRQHL